MGILVIAVWVALWAVVVKAIADDVRPECSDDDCYSCPFPCERRSK